MATSDRPGALRRWLYSTKNIAGCAAGVVGPVLAGVGVVAPPVGLALIPALYAIGALVAPPARRVNLAAGMDPADVRRGLADLQRKIRGRVPAEVATRVAHIAATITETLPRADALDGANQDLWVLAKTATDYLPATLQTYLDLPRGYADRHVVSGDKTSLGLLCDQLDLLATRLDAVADAANQSDTDRLLANGRFLADKFGRGDLDLPGPPGTARP